MPASHKASRIPRFEQRLERRRTAMQVTDVRSAVEQQRKNTPRHDNTPSPAVPCFLFGMHDAYCNPLGRIDEAIFNRTGMNLPLWVPTRAASTCDNCMAFGGAVDPACFTAHTCSCARGGQRERMRTGPGRRKVSTSSDSRTLLLALSAPLSH